MESEEYGREEIHAYLEQAGGIRVTKTHGRRSVAGLNQMDNCLWKIPALVKKAGRPDEQASFHDTILQQS